MTQPQLIIIGGANGSGKTTFAREIAAEFNINYLGADDIAATLNSSAPEKAAIEAARMFSRKFNEGLMHGQSLVVESTLSGLSLAKFLTAARKMNYVISVFFVYLDSAELCIQRIASRVAKGGHHVPDADVRRRFDRANKNFWQVYKHLADDWFLIFNAGDSFEQIANGDTSGVIIFDEERYRRVADSDKIKTPSKTVSEKTMRKSIEFQGIGNRAVHRAQEESRRLGILNWYSIGGEIISDQEILERNKEK